MADTLEAVWEYREETLYPRLFGAESHGIYVLDRGDFAAFGCDEVDPRWLFLGVFEFEPTSTRPTWCYVTSGGSTPWEHEPPFDDDPERYSWLGVELSMETPARAEWAIRLLNRMLAFHVLAAHGHFGERPGLDYGVRAPVGGPIDGQDSVLTHVLATTPGGVDATQQLASGKFDLLHFVGLAPTELEFAKANGNEALLARLKASGAAPITDPARKPVC